MKRRVVATVLVLIFLVVVASAYYAYSTMPSTNLSSGLSALPGSSSTTASTMTSVTLPTRGGLGWTTYHADNARTGYASVSNFTSVTRGWTSPTLDGGVYAEPLVFGNSVFVATENNSVYALNTQSGAIEWKTELGTPVAQSALQCGNIDPSGITGTPVVDPSTDTVFVVTFTHLRHFLIGLSTVTGTVSFNESADPPNFDVTAQQQRSALSLANGMVYIPYGGLAGDCGQYHGYVVGLTINSTAHMDVYRVPTSREGAIWAPSGAAIDFSGTLYVATGNGASDTTFDHGDAVISLTPSLSEIGYFAPTNWAQLNDGDADLGSVGPAIVGQGALFQIGKGGVGYLLKASALGGISNSFFSSNVCSGSYGGTAFLAPTIFVPCLNGLFALDIGTDSFSTLWHVGGYNAGPPIVTDGVVWSVDISSPTLYGYRASTGQQLYSFPLGAVEHFITPSAGGGFVFVAADKQVDAFSVNAG